MDSSHFLHVWGLLQWRSTCTAPTCMCAQALLFVWPGGKGQHYELRTREGRRFEGSASTEADALRYGELTLREQGLQRCRVVHGRPTEVPHA